VTLQLGRPGPGSGVVNLSVCGLRGLRCGKYWGWWRDVFLGRGMLRNRLGLYSSREEGPHMLVMPVQSV
jgi:hypothetical protein